MHSSHLDGETEAHSSKVTSKGPMTCGKQSQAWQTQDLSPPSSLLTVAPCCVAHYDPCHTSKKMSPPLKDGEHPPSGACLHAWVMQEELRVARWELGTFQEKLGWNHRSHFLADSSHYPSTRNDCFAHAELSWGWDLLPHVLTAELLLAHPLGCSQKCIWHEDDHGTIVASLLFSLLHLPWINNPSLHCCPKLLGQF